MVGRVPGPEAGHHGRGGAALLEGPRVAGQGLGGPLPLHRGGEGVVQAHLPGVVRGDLELHPPAADGRRQPTVVLQRDEAPRGGRSQGDFDGDARRVPSEADVAAAQGVRAQGVRGGLRIVREAGSGRVFCLLHNVLRIVREAGSGRVFCLLHNVL